MAHGSKRFDWLLWGSLVLLTGLYLQHWLFRPEHATEGWLAILGHSVFELINTVWWGILFGILMIAVLGRIPREFVMTALGTSTGPAGIVRATVGGVLLDLCSHGILMVGAKLHERGASTGQVIAFLVSSPWNSFSLTLILVALVGLPWTLGFIALSMVIAVITGLIFDYLVRVDVLPANPSQVDIPEDFAFWRQARQQFSETRFTRQFMTDMLLDGLAESRMVLRWIFFGILLASCIRAFVSPEQFGDWFGPTLAGLGLTVLAATIIEVCSEGSTPVAADLLNRANAPGNGFAFLMSGVATDYTEIMVLREATSSWRIPLFLPLITLPQVILLGWLINQASL